MKVFERLVLRHLKEQTDALVDPGQFAYRANRSVDDAVALGLHHILQHQRCLQTHRSCKCQRSSMFLPLQFDFIHVTHFSLCCLDFEINQFHPF